MQKENGIASEESTPSKRRRFDPAYGVLMIAVVVAGFYLVKVMRENAELKSSLNRGPASAAFETLFGPPSMQTGDIVPPFGTVGLQGQPANVLYDGRKKSVIFVFSPACDVCAHEIPTWNRIALQATSKGYAVRGISLDSVEDSQKNLASKEVQFEVVIMPSMAIKRAYRVVGIPEILLVSENGTVTWAHYGAMSDNKVAELLSEIGTN